MAASLTRRRWLVGFGGPPSRPGRDPTLLALLDAIEKLSNEGPRLVTAMTGMAEAVAAFRRAAAAIPFAFQRAAEIPSRQAEYQRKMSMLLSARA